MGAEGKVFEEMHVRDRNISEGQRGKKRERGERERETESGWVEERE